MIDGEAVVLGVDGVSDLSALHSGKHNDEVQLCAFDVLAQDGADLPSFRYLCARQTLTGSGATTGWDLHQPI